MKPAKRAQARGQPVAFAAEMLGSLPRCDQRRWGETYLRGHATSLGALSALRMCSSDRRLRSPSSRR